MVRSSFAILVFGPLTVAFAGVVFAIVQQIRETGFNAAMLLPVILLSAVYAMLFSLRLETEVNMLGISYRLYPFHITPRLVRWDEIHFAEVRKYAPLREYGGWGIKGTRSNRAFNISGSTGLQLYLSDGSKLLLGTHKKAEIEQVIKALMESGKIRFIRSA